MCRQGRHWPQNSQKKMVDMLARVALMFGVNLMLGSSIM
jgi:hypothetical protein